MVCVNTYWLPSEGYFLLLTSSARQCKRYLPLIRRLKSDSKCFCRAIKHQQLRFWPIGYLPPLSADRRQDLVEGSSAKRDNYSRQGFCTAWSIPAETKQDNVGISICWRMTARTTPWFYLRERGVLTIIFLFIFLFISDDFYLISLHNSYRLGHWLSSHRLLS